MMNDTSWVDVLAKLKEIKSTPIEDERLATTIPLLPIVIMLKTLK